MKEYLKLFRMKQYIKNILIFIPIFFANKFYQIDFLSYFTILLGFVSFSLTCSIIYIINDICDIEQDKLDEIKKNRPLASGKISIKNAIISIILLVILNIIINIYLKNLYCIIILFIYLGLNILYSFLLKNIPILDIIILSLFYIIRIFYGGLLMNISISIYLFLTTFSAALFLGSCKRLCELKSNKKMRKVLEKYNEGLLIQFISVFMSTTIIFYSLWVMNYTNFIDKNCLFISIILVIIILMLYRYKLEITKNGNPTDMLLSNKDLLLVILLYISILLIGIF